jgi:hypothetical protein
VLCLTDICWSDCTHTAKEDKTLCLMVELRQAVGPICIRPHLRVYLHRSSIYFREELEAQRPTANTSGPSYLCENYASLLFYSKCTFCILIPHTLSQACTTSRVLIVAMILNTDVPILIIKPTRCTNFSYLFLEWNYVFRTVPLSIIRSYSLYTRQWYTSYSFVDSYRAAAAAAGSGWNCSSILILLPAC